MIAKILINSTFLVGDSPTKKTASLYIDTMNEAEAYFLRKILVPYGAVETRSIVLGYKFELPAAEPESTSQSLGTQPTKD